LIAILTTLTILLSSNIDRPLEEYVVEIKNKKNKFLGTGCLIDERHILTARHNLVGIDEKDEVLVFSSLTKWRGIQMIGRLNKTRKDVDLAELVLDSPLEIEPIRKGPIKKNTEILIYGMDTSDQKKTAKFVKNHSVSKFGPLKDLIREAAKRESGEIRPRDKERCEKRINELKDCNKETRAFSLDAEFGFANGIGLSRGLSGGPVFNKRNQIIGLSVLSKGNTIFIAPVNAICAPDKEPTTPQEICDAAKGILRSKETSRRSYMHVVQMLDNTDQNWTSLNNARNFKLDESHPIQWFLWTAPNSSADSSKNTDSDSDRKDYRLKLTVVSGSRVSRVKIWRYQREENLSESELKYDGRIRRNASVKPGNPPEFRTFIIKDVQVGEKLLIEVVTNGHKNGPVSGTLSFSSVN